MKKVFFILLASAAFAIGGCNSTDHDDDDAMDSVEMRNQVNEAMDSVNNMRMDTMQDTMRPHVDTPR